MNTEYINSVQFYISNIYQSIAEKNSVFLTVQQTSLPNCNFDGLFLSSKSHSIATDSISYRLKDDVNLASIPCCLPNKKQGIAPNTILCLYTGSILKTKEAMNLADKSYLMRLGEQCYVDAREFNNVLARFINDCIDPHLHNVKFIKIPELYLAVVISTRHIRPGEELFVDYGKWYWLLKKSVRMKIKPTSTLEIKKGSVNHFALTKDGDDDG